MTELEFNQKISAWVSNALELGVNGFQELIRTLPGVDPILTMLALEKIRNESNSSQINCIIEEAASGDKPALARRFSECEVVPHPLDFDWRFSQSTIDFIVKKLSEGNFENILLVGTPSIAFALESMCKSLDVTFVDTNESWATHFQNVTYIHADVMQSDSVIPDRKFDAVVIDPPWYVQHFKAFMYFASRSMKQNGKVLVAFPGEGTRPGIETERSDLDIFANTIGLDLCSEEKNIISYETPPFEYNAFTASGITLWANDWRRADLITYVKMRSTEMIPPVSPKQLSNWSEVNLHGVRIKFLCSYNQSGPISLESLLPGDILPSVSNRHPIRDNATIWTSGNRIYTCSNPSMLYQLLKNYQLNLPCTSISNDMKAALEHLRTIIRIEITEYIDLDECTEDEAIVE